MVIGTLGEYLAQTNTYTQKEGLCVCVSKRKSDEVDKAERRRSSFYMYYIPIKYMYSPREVILTYTRKNIMQTLQTNGIER